MNKLLVLISGLLLLKSGGSYANDSTEVDNRIVIPHAYYIGDAAYNFFGGLKTGGVYMGFVDLSLDISSERFWQGGKLTIGLQNTHGQFLSGDLTGDIQTISNIENGNYTYISQLVYTQLFKNETYIALGLHYLDHEFLVSEFGGEMIHSSFGTPAMFALNIPAPIFPKSSLSLVFGLPLSKNLAFKTGIYDGDPGLLTEDPHNLDWSIQDVLSISELNLTLTGKLNTILKLGGYYHSGDFRSYCDTTEVLSGNYGLYLLADAHLLLDDARKLGFFAQLGKTPDERNFNTKYIGIGSCLHGPFKSRVQDIFSFGAAIAEIYDGSVEYDFEINYQLFIHKNISLRPVFHYIINPGANKGLNNALVGLLRIHLEI